MKEKTVPIMLSNIKASMRQNKSVLKTVVVPECMFGTAMNGITTLILHTARTIELSRYADMSNTITALWTSMKKPSMFMRK